MKYFAVETPQGEDELFTSIRSLRERLKQHPEIAQVHRYWWYGSDLVECTPLSRDEILGTKAKELKAGMTNRWAASRGRL